jgi:hypothetical protein
MPLDAEALNSTIYTLRLTQEAIPALWREDTADELLTVVQMTFNELIVAVLAEPLPLGAPTDGPPLATRAALHARAICDLLTALAIVYWRNTGSDLTTQGMAEAPPTLTRRWIDEIAKASLGEARPQHDTAAQYVRGAASALTFVARMIRTERGLSLDPDDPRGPVERPDDAMTGDDAGGLLIWCGAAALCIAATLQPQFRTRSAP